ncbi:MAG TPA: rhamnogalacturonan acetylesterase [Candidatus Mediterraneibacter cottocaccae]|nr:rhamnogalacturonan acetylesterase [Candidatus Mediterraneibacter cottocaccae]
MDKKRKTITFRMFELAHKEKNGNALITIPDLTNGFDAGLETWWKGMEPVSFYTPGCVRQGIYKIHIRLRAIEDTGSTFLFTGRKQLQDILYMQKGETLEREYYQVVSEYVPRYRHHAYMVERLFLTVCTADKNTVAVEACTAQECAVHESVSRNPAGKCTVQEQPVPRVFLCGDSTVADQCGEIPYEPGACYASWGQALPAFLGLNAAVDNQAHSGNTTETFRNDGHFALVQHHMGPGDLCLFQFGHNDQKRAYLQPEKEYRRNLLRFIEEVNRAGAVPVLVTPLGRNMWSADGTYFDLLEEYADMVRRIGEETGTRVIDLHIHSVDFYKEKGKEVARGYFHPGDSTHTNEYGAYLFAAFIAEKLAEYFPDIFPEIRTGVDFKPQGNLWEELAAETNRKEGSGEAEVWDRVEKSEAELIKAVMKAREESRYI